LVEFCRRLDQFGDMLDAGGVTLDVLTATYNGAILGEVMSASVTGGGGVKANVQAPPELLSESMLGVSPQATLCGYPVQFTFRKSVMEDVLLAPPLNPFKGWYEVMVDGVRIGRLEAFSVKLPGTQDLDLNHEAYMPISASSGRLVLDDMERTERQWTAAWVMSLNGFRMVCKLVVDLSGDEVCRVLLRALSRRPWDAAARDALVDRCLELGHEDAAPVIRGMAAAALANRETYTRTRTRRRRVIDCCTENLRQLFGEFEEAPF
jgi:hypothetical protein